MSITLRSRRGAIGTTWQGTTFRRAAEGLLGLQRSAAGGRTDARAGKVQWLDVAPGLARADVLDEMGEIRSPRLEMTPMLAGDRAIFFQVAAAHPEFPAKLAAGEYPEEIEKELATSLISLLPRQGDLTHDCSCLDWPGPCRHIAALVYVLTEAIDENPAHLLTLRGVTVRDLVEAGRAGEAEADRSEAEDDTSGSEDDVVAGPSMEPALLDPALLSPVLGEQAAGILTVFYRASTPTDDADAAAESPDATRDDSGSDAGTEHEDQDP